MLMKAAKIHDTLSVPEKHDECMQNAINRLTSRCLCITQDLIKYMVSLW